jgi:excisionase family DNA binding protein
MPLLQSRAASDRLEVSSVSRQRRQRVNENPGTVVDRKVVSIMKACEAVGVSRRTIYNWIAAGKVEYIRTAGGAIRIYEDTLWRSPDSAAPTA